MAGAHGVDRFQRTHSWLGFPIAVVYKLFDDRAPYLAALITYYAFVSLFPLLLLFLSGAGFFLDGHPQLRHQLVTAALKNFPGLSGQLQSNIAAFHGNGVALGIGVVGTIYGALGAMQAAQVAFNQVYGVPRNEQPNPVKSRIRSLGLIALLGTAVLLSTGIASIVSTAGDVLQQLGLHHYRVEVTFGGYVLAFVLNSALFTAAFELLTARDLRIHNTITGGLLAGGLWELLQVFGSRYVTHEVNHSGSLYGLFGVVLALIAWIYLQALALMLAAEVNVVLHHRLWPRALLTPFTDDVELTDADRRAYHMYAMVQRFKGFERVDTDFAKSAASSARGSGSAVESDSAVGATRALEPYPEEPRPQPARVPAETPRS